MKKLKQISIITVIMITISGLAAAQASPTAFLQNKDKKLAGLVQDVDKNEDKIVKIVGKMLDFDTLCKDSLGKHWDTRSEAERKEFSDTLKSLIEKNIVDRLKSTKDRAITYESESIDGEKALVITFVPTGDDPRDEPLKVEYKMVKKDGKWGVVDMITDETSLVSNYRSQFNKIIVDEGWETLMKKMKDKLAENNPQS